MARKFLRLKILALKKLILNSPRKRWNIFRQIFISHPVYLILYHKVIKEHLFCSIIGRMVVQQITAIVTNSCKSIIDSEINSISGFDKSRIFFLPFFPFLSIFFHILPRFPVFHIQITLQSTRESFPVLRKICALAFILR